MNRNLIAIGIFFFFISSAWAFNYTAPIEPDNGFKIYGQSENFSCIGECVYYFEIENNLGKNESIEIKPYFDSEPLSVVLEKEIINTELNRVEVCIEYEPPTYAPDGLPLERACKKTELKWVETKTTAWSPASYVIEPATKKMLNKDFVLKKKFNSDSVAREKYRVVFNPAKNQGQIIILTNSIIDPTKKASLDPWWSTLAIRKPINIWGTHDALDVNTTVFALDLNSQTWGCANDNNRLALVRQDTNKEIAIDIEGTCGTSGDLNIMFRMPQPIAANADWNGTDTNGLMLYVLNATRLDANRNLRDVYWGGDNFETNTLANYTNNASASWFDSGSIGFAQNSGQKNVAYNMGVEPVGLVVQARMFGTTNDYAPAVCTNFNASASSARGHCTGGRTVNYFTEQPNVSVNTDTTYAPTATEWSTIQIIEITDSNYYARGKNTNADANNAFGSWKSSQYRNTNGINETGFANLSNTYVGFYSANNTGLAFIDWWKAWKWLAVQPSVTVGASESPPIPPDANAPVIVYTDINGFLGFSNSPTLGTSLRMQCQDDYASLRYVMQLNDTNVYDATDANNTLVEVVTTLANGLNVARFYCFDINNSDSAELQEYHYLSKFNIIDENNALAFNWAYDVNSIKAYSADTNSSFDFNAGGYPYTVYFGGQEGDTVVFEIVYNDSLNQRITKYFTIDLLDQNTNVCASHFQQFYQQIMVSYDEQPVWVENNFANCYILAAYTKYAYKNSKSVQAYTIPRPYELRTLSDGTQTVLSNIDGGLASEINLDTLTFQKTLTNISITDSYVAFAPLFNQTTKEYDSNVVQIHYLNYSADNNSVNLKIYQESSLLLNYDIPSGLDNWTYDWNYTTHGLDNNAILRLVIATVKDDGESETETVYFNLLGTYSSPAVFNEWVGIVLAFSFVLFGISMTAYRYALGWFGIVACLIALGILAFSPAYWFVQFAQAIIITVIIFIGLIFRGETAQVS